MALNHLEIIVVQKTHLPNRVCENHPHNFYLDILGDTGLLGMSLIISSILILLIKVYKDYLKEMKEKIIFQIGLI